MSADLIWFEDLKREDVALVGGKNSSLGEMISTLGPKGIRVPTGFATTSDAYRAFVAENDLGSVIADHVAALEAGRMTLAEVGTALRRTFERGHWPEAVEADIRAA